MFKGKIIEMPGDWIKNPAMPPTYRDFHSNVPGFDEWRFRLSIPTLPEFSKLISKMAKVSGVEDSSKFVEQINDFTPMLAQAAADLTIVWNFLDSDGEPLPSPNGDIEIVNRIRTEVAWDYLMQVADFIAKLQSGGAEPEVANKS